jgi:myo-inositol 2-dehydrogenase/D-chiro-inositol 1-dehydrogenase
MSSIEAIPSNRRTFLANAGSTFCSLPAFASFAAGLPVARATEAPAPKSPNDRWRIGCIGMRYQGSVITREALPFGDVVAICDVDRHVREQARASFGSAAELFEDYRDLLAKAKVDVVLIGTPDHWHARMLIDAVRAGKDVYCEKPLTLTIAEGQPILKAVRETGRVVQVGTWQRSDARFRLACEMIRAGRLGAIQKVTVLMGKNPVGGPFAPGPVPKHFDWDLWQGQTPDRPYLAERSHYTFRWWLDYSGGEMTDTGAHHLDIAQWALGVQHTGPVEIRGEATWPAGDAVGAGLSYNVPESYRVVCRYASGVELTILDRPEGEHTRNGLMFEGELGRLFVNRGVLAGKPVEELEAKPLPREAFSLYADNLSRPERMGKLDAIKNHMGNFYDCTLSRAVPVSDVTSQHRSVSLCHLGNIACRLGRPLKWNPESEQFEGDAEANALLARPQRVGFEVV